MSVKVRRKRSDRLYWAAALAFVAAHILLALRELSRPGVYYDEILMLMPMYDRGRWQHTPGWSPIPFFFTFYVGGLRLWYYYPFLKIFPLSLELLRIPNILLYAGSLAILAGRFLRPLGAPLALVLVGALALNANLMAAARTDFVPFILGFLFRGLLLAWVYDRSLSRPGLRSLGTGSLLLSAGVFHRLDFLWGAAGILGAGVAAELCLLLGEGRLKAVWPRVAGRAAVLAGVSLLSAYVMSGAVRPGGELGLDYSVTGRALMLSARLESVLLGKSFAEYDLGAPFPSLPGTLAFYLAAMAAPFLTPPRGRIFRLGALCALYCVVVFAVVFFVRRVGASWHMLLFEPMLVIWWATGAYALVEITRVKWQRRAATFTVAGLVFGWLLVVHAYTYLAYQKTYALPDRAISFHWNRAIYDLVEFRRAHPGEVYVDLGWGSHREAGSLAFRRPVADGGTFADIGRLLGEAKHGRLLVVVPAARLDGRTGADAEEVRKFREAVAGKRLKAELRATIGDPGYPVYEIWSCTGP